MTLRRRSLLAGAVAVAVSLAVSLAAASATSNDDLLMASTSSSGERTGRVDLVAHHDNFFAAVRGKAELNADVSVGHRLAAIDHLADIAACRGRFLNSEPTTERIDDDVEVDTLIRQSCLEFCQPRIRDGIRWQRTCAHPFPRDNTT
ncbi:MAG: hypothetical protein GY878_19275 [Fuerstiella sp.]|nr:hypothetical protein [Fuerstiella sp.]